MKNSLKGKPRLLLVGPLPHPQDTLGGAKVNFGEMVRYMKAGGHFEVEVVSISRGLYGKGRLGRLWRNSTALVRVLWTVLLKVRGAHMVSLNCGATAHPALYLGVCGMARWFHKPLVVRFFGGDLVEIWVAMKPWKRWLFKHSVMKADMVLVQTKEILKYFASQEQVRWFPNTRDLEIRPPKTEGSIVDGPPQKLLFLSQVKDTKGIREALELSDRLGERCHLHVYGPLKPPVTMAWFENHKHVTYHGVAERENIPKILSSHHLLLFPTYFEGEGYPGIIIEAMQCGLPVVATRWLAIPEVLEDGVSGLLVEPKDVDALEAAMNRFFDDPNLLRELAQGAAARGDFFRGAKWYGSLQASMLKLLDD